MTTPRIVVRIISEPDLDALIPPAVEAVPGVIGAAAVDSLQAGDSDWPVDTGLSKASFGFAVHGDRAEITNSTDYAGGVEIGTGAAESTLRRDLPRIAQEVDNFIQGMLDG